MGYLVGCQGAPTITKSLPATQRNSTIRIPIERFRITGLLILRSFINICRYSLTIRPTFMNLTLSKAQIRIQDWNSRDLLLLGSLDSFKK